MSRRSEVDGAGSGCLIMVGVAIAIAVVAAIIFSVACVHRVEPGTVGLRVDYGRSTGEGQPVIDQVSVGYYIIGVQQRIVSYPISQQTLTMVEKASDGKVEGDDSVKCQDHNGVQVNVDSSTLWRINVDQAESMYLKRPNMPLVSKGGDDIEDNIVRRDVRNAITLACSTYTYDQMYGDSRVKFGQDAEKLLRASLEASYIVLDSFIPGEIHLQQKQKDAIDAVATASQQARQAAFLKEKADNEAAGRIAQANGEAKAIQILNEAIGNSPRYIEYITANKWDGHLPQVSSGSTPLISLPLASPTPAPAR